MIFTTIQPDQHMIKMNINDGLPAYTLIDFEDYERLSQFKWQLGSDGYARKTYRKDGEKFQVRMHREILSAPKSLMVDHINNSPLDNRKCNLRLCTNQENQMNSRPNGDRKYKGVYHHTKGKWESAITHNKRRIYLGLFSTPRQAALAYDNAAKILFGKFAKYNFSNDDGMPTLSDLIQYWAMENDIGEDESHEIESQKRKSAQNNA